VTLELPKSERSTKAVLYALSVMVYLGIHVTEEGVPILDEARRRFISYII